MGRQIGGGEDILERHWHAAQRQCREACRVGGAARRVEIERDEGADVFLARGDRLGAKLDRVARL